MKVTDRRQDDGPRDALPDAGRLRAPVRRRPAHRAEAEGASSELRVGRVQQPRSPPGEAMQEAGTRVARGHSSTPTLADEPITPKRVAPSAEALRQTAPGGRSMPSCCPRSRS